MMKPQQLEFSYEGIEPIKAPEKTELRTDNTSSLETCALVAVHVQ